MLMYASTTKIHGTSYKTTILPIIVGFIDQLQGWWDNCLGPVKRDIILNVIKKEVNDNVDGLPTKDSINTLVHTILLHFVGSTRIS